MTPLSMELSIGSMKVPKRRGGTVPRFPAGIDADFDDLGHGFGLGDLGDGGGGAEQHG